MKTHPLNVSYLVIGLVFLGISGSWVLLEAGVIGAADIGWLVPVSLVVAGGVGLVAAVAKSLTRRDEAPQAYDAGYVPTYDAPLPQDYTSDLDRKLDEQATSVIPTDPAGSPHDSDTTTVIHPQTDLKDENR